MPKLVYLENKKGKANSHITGQKEHTNWQSKLKSRQHIIKVLKQEGITEPNILDVFCGHGRVWKEAYNKTPLYVGLDKKQFNDERKTIVCDNIRYLRHKHASLDDFDLFDLDAYGSPFEHLAVISSRLKWERTSIVGIAITDGGGFNAKMNQTNRGLLNYLGLSEHKHGRFQWENREDIIKMAILKSAEIARAEVTDIAYYAPIIKGRGSLPIYASFLFRHF